MNKFRSKPFVLVVKDGVISHVETEDASATKLLQVLTPVEEEKTSSELVYEYEKEDAGMAFIAALAGAALLCLMGSGGGVDGTVAATTAAKTATAAGAEPTFELLKTFAEGLAYKNLLL